MKRRSTGSTSPADYRARAAGMAEARRHKDAAVILALTSPGSDEKPLLVRCAPGDSRVLALGAAAAPSRGEGGLNIGGADRKGLPLAQPHRDQSFAERLS